MVSNYLLNKSLVIGTLKQILPVYIVLIINKLEMFQPGEFSKICLAYSVCARHNASWREYGNEEDAVPALKKLTVEHHMLYNQEHVPCYPQLRVQSKNNISLKKVTLSKAMCASWRQPASNDWSRRDYAEGLVHCEGPSQCPSSWWKGLRSSSWLQHSPTPPSTQSCSL